MDTSQVLTKAPFIHSLNEFIEFFRQLHTESLLCARPCFNHLEYINEQNEDSYLGKYIKSLEYLVPESKEVLTD